MSLQELVDGAHAFIKDCMDASRGQVLSVCNMIPPKLLKCLEQLMFSVNGTTDSAILLIEEGCVWDSSILLRSVLDGTARACYLMSAKTQVEEDRRLSEFQELLPKAEMGGLDQPLRGLINSPYCKVELEDDPIFGPLKSIVDEMKPGEGEGKPLREVKTRWNFFRISKVLLDEFPTWAKYAPLFEYRYAISNQLVHKTDTGCGQVLERQMREPCYRELSELAHAETVAMALCFATYTRLVALSERQRADTESFLDVWLKHRRYFEDAQKIEDEFVVECKKRAEEDS